MERTQRIVSDVKLLFAAVAVMLLFSSSAFVMPAYAYSSSVSAPESTLGSGYGSVDICSYTGCGSPASVVYDGDCFTLDSYLCFDTSSVCIVQKNNGTYCVSGSASINGHYAVVDGNLEGMRLYAVLTENGDGNLENIVYTLRINGIVFDDCCDSIYVECGTAYRIDITADLSCVCGNLHYRPVLPTLCLEIMVSTDGGASTVTADRITLKYTSADASNDIVELNREEKGIVLNDGDDNYSYTEDDGKEYYIVPNEARSDGHAAVYITNGDDSTLFASSDQFAGSDSRATTLELPAGKEFVIQVDISGGFIISGGTVIVEITIGNADSHGDIVYSTYTGEVKKNGTAYLHVKNPDSKNLGSASSLSNVAWMSGDFVSVRLAGTASSYWSDVAISLQIVFS